MPEGDTIFRTARTLHSALAGRVVTGFHTVLPSLERVHHDTPLTGRTIVSARSLGKHLLITFSGDLILRTHMRMHGQWHIYRPGERWRRRRDAMRVVVETDAYVAVAFDVPVAEFLTTRELPRHRELARVGPDLLAEHFDQETARARLRANPDRPVGEALIDQRVMAGIGNVFKCEVLFLCGVQPFRRVGDLNDDECRRLVRVARQQLQANVLPGARGRQTTRAMNPEVRLWVYGRGGRPCRRCGTSIESTKQGEDARLTYWCPTCQM